MTEQKIDLRSDTVTTPTAAMRLAMKNAEVGDDVYGSDPSIERLEKRAAELLGLKAALFFPSGTQSNLTALLSQLQRGDEYITGRFYHCYRYEGGGAAALGGIHPHPLEVAADGSLSLTRVEQAIHPADFHFAPTKLLALENTHYGKVVGVNYFKAARELTQRHGLLLHLDGARLFNAAVRLGVEVRAITQYVDSLSVCLSKGLSAPVGSLLLANEAQLAGGFMERARRWRKTLGGGLRQAGVLAAAGLIALEEGPKWLAEDHENSALLYEQLSQLEELAVEVPQTNMVFFSLRNPKQEKTQLLALQKRLFENNILTMGGSGKFRLVVHREVNRAAILKVVGIFKAFFSNP